MRGEEGTSSLARPSGDRGQELSATYLVEARVALLGLLAREVSQAVVFFLSIVVGAVAEG